MNKQFSLFYLFPLIVLPFNIQASGTPEWKLQSDDEHLYFLIKTTPKSPPPCIMLLSEDEVEQKSKKLKTDEGSLDSSDPLDLGYLEDGNDGKPVGVLQQKKSEKLIWLHVPIDEHGTAVTPDILRDTKESLYDFFKRFRPEGSSDDENNAFLEKAFGIIKPGERPIDTLKASKVQVHYQVTQIENIDDYGQRAFTSFTETSTSSESSASNIPTWDKLEGAYKVKLSRVLDEDETETNGCFYATEDSYGFYPGKCGWANQLNKNHSRTKDRFKGLVYTGKAPMFHHMIALGRRSGSFDNGNWITGTHLDTNDTGKQQNQSVYFGKKDQPDHDLELSQQLADKYKPVAVHKERSEREKYESLKGSSQLGASLASGNIVPTLEAIGNLLQQPNTQNFLQNFFRGFGSNQ